MIFQEHTDEAGEDRDVKQAQDDGKENEKFDDMQLDTIHEEAEVSVSIHAECVLHGRTNYTQITIHNYEAEGDP